jgi:hypothetical protein
MIALFKGKRMHGQTANLLRITTCMLGSLMWWSSEFTPCGKTKCHKLEIEKGKHAKTALQKGFFLRYLIYEFRELDRFGFGGVLSRGGGRTDCNAIFARSETGTPSAKEQCPDHQQIRATDGETQCENQIRKTKGQEK